eukprot:EC692890.1.p1 GENE.EC692890.1~~EC692890.1.p1  ORF type:complete len:199 (+),score=45.45 EC692890.1:133-729(+)
MMKLFVKVDPFLEPQTKEEDYNHLHTVLILLLCAAVISFAVVEFVAFARRESTETFALAPMSEYAPLSAELEVTCQGTCGPLVVTQNVPAGCPVAAFTDTYSTFPVKITTQLCATARQDQGLQLDFTNMGATSLATVQVFSEPMTYRADLQQWHKKTILLGLSVKKSDDAVTSREAYLASLQYDGTTAGNVGAICASS